MKILFQSSGPSAALCAATAWAAARVSTSRGVRVAGCRGETALELLNTTTANATKFAAGQEAATQLTRVTFITL